jgi:hypothetical protein
MTFGVTPLRPAPPIREPSVFAPPLAVSIITILLIVVVVLLVLAVLGRGRF